VAECDRRGLAASCVPTAVAPTASAPAELIAVRVEEDEIPEGYAIQPPPAPRARAARRTSRGRTPGPEPPASRADDEAAVDPAGAVDEPTEDDATARRHKEYEVRTAYSTKLLPLASAWLADGTTKIAPGRLVLRGPALRLWVQACGRLEAPDDYRLEVGAEDEASWPAVRAALAAAGVRAELLRTAPGGPVLRLRGRRRVGRLAELIGDPPRPAPEGVWPSS
jgi:hypothetical protein